MSENSSKFLNCWQLVKYFHTYGEGQVQLNSDSVSSSSQFFLKLEIWSL